MSTVTSRLRRFCPSLVSIFFALSASVSASAQSGFRTQLQGPPENSGSAAIRDAFNRPCLQSTGIARAHVVNQDLIDHLVRLENRCPRVLKLKVCYFIDEQCKTLDLGPYKKEQILLGMMPKVTQFKFFIFQK